MKLSLFSYRSVICSSICFWGMTTWAAGFMVFEQNAVGVGNFNAGSAALAQDASTAFYNPAGLVRITQPQITGELLYVDTQMKFSGEVSNTLHANALNQPQVLDLGGKQGKAEGGGEFYLPTFHAVLPINKDFAAAFSFVIPYGLESDYGAVARYAATDTKITVYDWMPSVGFRVNNKLSLGLGVDLEYLTTEFDGVGGGLIPSLDTVSKNKAGGWGVGAHVGMLYEWSPQTRLGLNYQTTTSFNAKGKSEFIGPLAGESGFAENKHLSTHITLPAHTDLSIYHAFDEHWAVMGSVTYTQWEIFKQLKLKNVVAVQEVTLSPFPDLTVGPTFLVVHENFHNTWRIATGVDYQFNPRFLVRMGVGYDEAPTNSTDRGLRLPDAQRLAAAIGFHAQLLPKVGLDLGWTHLFIKNPSLHHENVMGPQYTQVRGKVKNSADLLAAQITVDLA